MRGQYIRKMKCLYDNKGKCRRDLWVETAAAEAAEREVLHPEAVPLLEEALLQEAVLQEAVGSAEGERHVYLPAAVLHRGAAVRLQETAVLHRGTGLHQGTAAVRHQAEAAGRKREAAVYRQEAAQRQGAAAGVLPVSLRGIRHLTGVKAVSGGAPPPGQSPYNRPPQYNGWNNGGYPPPPSGGYPPPPPGGNPPPGGYPPPPSGGTPMPPPGGYSSPPPGPPPRASRPPRQPRPPRERWFRNGSGYGGVRPARSMGCLGGCLTPFLILFVIVIAVVVIVSSGGRKSAPSGTREQQNVQEQAPPPVQQKAETESDNQYSEAAVPTVAEYFTDKMGWIKQADVLNAGMEAFFKKTGVKPYLYLTDNINGNTEPSDEEMDAFAGDLYDKLFTDENHFLLVFQEYGDYYMTWYVSGGDAAEIMDEEAANIVLDYVDEYYSSDMGEEEYFSNVFSMAAGKIMETRP